MSKAAKPKTSRKRVSLLNSPQNVSDEVWYYEEEKGLMIVDYLQHGLEFTPKKFVYLPWNMVCASVDRYRAVQRAKKSKKAKAKK